MSLTFTRPTMVNSSGLSTNGTVVTAEFLTAIFDAIDAARGSLTTVTPSTITSNQNNYNPPSLSTAQVLRLSSDASRTLTGIVGAGMFTLLNAGVNNIVLAHESASSTAANRILCPGGTDFTLNTHDAVDIFYDSAAARWHVKAA